MNFLAFCTFLLCLCSVSSFKMVFFVLDICNSQVLFNERVAETLAAAGHDVTMVLISPLGEKGNENVMIVSSIKVYHLKLSISTSSKLMDAEQEEHVFQELAGKKLIERLLLQTTMFVETCKEMKVLCNNYSQPLFIATLVHKEFLRWLENEHFDLAFTHMFDVCTIGLVHNAKIPSWIWLNSGSVMDYVAQLTGIPIIPSYVPPMMMEMAGEMKFFERVKSMIGHGLMKLLWRRLVADPETAVFRQMIRSDFPDLLDLAAGCPLVMANTNDLYEMPRPTLAKVVNIGGIGMESRDVKPLPKDIEVIMQKGDGAVLLSFGSVAVAHRMPVEWKITFLETFKRFPNYNFLMRYESDDIKGNLSENVHLFKWFPQTDILHHPRTKAFITHGGYNSLQEAILAGVPLITIPLFGDQPKNARLAEHHGMGLVLHKTELSVSSLSAAIEELISIPKYAKSAKRLSRMVRHQPVSPIQLVVKWSEFVAEFQTLENLEPAGNKLNFFQYHSLDVIAFLTAALLVIVLLIVNATKLLCRAFLGIFTSKKQKVA